MTPPAGAALRRWFDRPEVVDLLREYFAPGAAPDGVPPFTGAWFEHLDDGGDRPEVADRITAADVLAVGALSVQIPARLALDLVQGPLSRRIADLLHRIPIDLDLVDAGDEHIGPESPAWRAWELVRGQDGAGWVTAGKLLARKRPRLVPVYDRVVKQALGWDSGFWLLLRAELRAEDRALQTRLLELRRAAGLSTTVSALRVLDVALWTAHGQRSQDRGSEDGHGGVGGSFGLPNSGSGIGVGVDHPQR